jgi:tetraacyldisaccharide 4'-kinase
VVTRKRARFLSGESASYRAPVPVIVVGNITVGGTGKTPMILWLIEHCRQRAEGRRGQPWLWRQAAATAVAGRRRAERRQAGDEPLLIVQRTGVPLMIDPTVPAPCRRCWPANRST